MQIMISTRSRRARKPSLLRRMLNQVGSPLDVAGEEILARDRDAHFVQRADQHAVAGLAAGAVGRRHVDVEIVDDVLVYV
jgi:hypothetical protein